MAYKTKYPESNNKAQKPSYSDRSKMRRYNIVYDEDIGTMRTGFMNFLKYYPSLENGDKVWEIEKGFEYRTDLISKKFYNTSQFDWIIEQVNNIKDPIKDVYVGRKLVIPSMENIYFLA